MKSRLFSSVAGLAFRAHAVSRRRSDPGTRAPRFGTAFRPPAVDAKPPAHRPQPQANFIGALLLAAAYGFLNQPAPPQPVLREATIVNAEEATFFDVGLDDASIPFDDGITAARKCGFCMG